MHSETSAPAETGDCWKFTVVGGIKRDGGVLWHSQPRSRALPQVTMVVFFF